MMATFLIEQIINFLFCQLQTIVCLWWFLASWLDSFQLKGLVDAFFVFD